MWGPWMAHHFHIQRNDLIANNVTIDEVLAMWDATK
jgi:hypothetical protein